jgi:hypothetical protein
LFVCLFVCLLRRTHASRSDPSCKISATICSDRCHVSQRR